MGNFIPLMVQLIAKNGIPLLANYAIEKVNHRTQLKIHNLESNRLNKTQLMITSGGSTSVSTTPLSKGFMPKETIEDLGRRKWTEYHNKIDSLPPNASEVEVHNSLKEIVDNIKVYPCLTCRENAIKNLKKYPILTSSVKTKQDGQKKLCIFHNAVRVMLNKPITHNCDSV